MMDSNNEHMFNHSLIMGGTGMLAEASTYVAHNSRTTVLASRSPQRLAKRIDAKPITLDWRVHELTLKALRNYSPFDLILSWVHDDGVWLVNELENMLVKGGRSIRVVGSGSNEFNIPNDQKTNQQFVSLGWVNGVDGRRWLTHTEISDAVIKAIENPKQRHKIIGNLS